MAITAIFLSTTARHLCFDNFCHRSLKRLLKKGRLQWLFLYLKPSSTLWLPLTTTCSSVTGTRDKIPWLFVSANVTNHFRYSRNYTLDGLPWMIYHRKRWWTTNPCLNKALPSLYEKNLSHTIITMERKENFDLLDVVVRFSAVFLVLLIGTVLVSICRSF